MFQCYSYTIIRERIILSHHHQGLYYKRWVGRQIDRSQRMYVNIMNCKTRRQKYCYQSYNESPL